MFLHCANIVPCSGYCLACENMWIVNMCICLQQINFVHFISRTQNCTAQCSTSHTEAKEWHSTKDGTQLAASQCSRNHPVIATAPWIFYCCNLNKLVTVTCLLLQGRNLPKSKDAPFMLGVLPSSRDATRIPQFLVIG